MESLINEKLKRISPIIDDLLEVLAKHVASGRADESDALLAIAYLGQRSERILRSVLKENLQGMADNIEEHNKQALEQMPPELRKAITGFVESKDCQTCDHLPECVSRAVSKIDGVKIVEKSANSMKIKGYKIGG